jgi:hypothetical protein
MSGHVKRDGERRKEQDGRTQVLANEESFTESRPLGKRKQIKY